MDFTFIIDLEKKLLNPSARKDVSTLNDLLSNDFVEFGTSGKIYNKKNIIERLPEEVPTEIKAFDFAPIQLATNIIQIRFKTRRTTQDGLIIASLRSSIWKFDGKRWQMIFHQGTKFDL